MSPCLSDTYSAVRRRLDQAARRAGRDPREVRLVAVTKGALLARVRELAGLGQLEFGENRADGLEQHALACADLAPAPVWHFLGHVQRNKLRRIAVHARVIHSLDSPALHAALARVGDELERDFEAYVEVKPGAEPTRTGLAPAAVEPFLAATRPAPRVRLCGLMTIAPRVEGDAAARLHAARAAFRALKQLALDLERRATTARCFVDGRVRTSMGMSEDFEVAVEEGSDLVRVGTALFAGLDAPAPAPRGDA